MQNMSSFVHVDHPHAHNDQPQSTGARGCGVVLVHNGRAPNLLEERDDGLAFVRPHIFTPWCDWLN